MSMNIHSIENRQDQATYQLKQLSVRGKSGISQELKEAMDKNQTDDGGKVQQSGMQGQGAVSLLQEGHFKGVADVRLQTHFFDQLQLMTTQKPGERVDKEIQRFGTDPDTPIQKQRPGNGGVYDRFLEIYKDLQNDAVSDSIRIRAIETEG